MHPQPQIEVVNVPCFHWTLDEGEAVGYSPPRKGIAQRHPGAWDSKSEAAWTWALPCFAASPARMTSSWSRQACWLSMIRCLQRSTQVGRYSTERKGAGGLSRPLQACGQCGVGSRHCLPLWGGSTSYSLLGLGGGWFSWPAPQHAPQAHGRCIPRHSADHQHASSAPAPAQ